MPEALKVLGQVALPATARTQIYLVPAGAQATISTVTVCNRTGGAASFRIAVAVANAVDDPKQYVCYDVTILKNSTMTFTLGITLGSGDALYGYASAANTLTMQAFGVEVT